MALKSVITVFAANSEPQAYDLDSFGKSQVYLGRGPLHGGAGSERNDIIIDQSVSAISRAHCTFKRGTAGWYVYDDESLNGLTFNGERIKQKQLHEGDKLYIGTEANSRCVLVFSTADRSQGAAAGDTAGGSLDALGKCDLKGKKVFTIGRDPKCDIVIAHPSVSRMHCFITHEKDGFYINDNNSLNGIIVNGQQLKGKRKLERMDKITIAVQTMLFDDKAVYLLDSSGGVSVVANSIVKKVKSGKGEKIITNNVSLSIEPGEFVAIVGGSGAGKTTLLNCLSGMADFTSGDILINGESIRTNERSIRSIIGYVPQNDIVYDNLTLEKMLYYSAKLRMPRDTHKQEIERKITTILEMVELTAHRKTMISKLSGGQKKRASIAVELLASPKLFFLDEPSSGLDPGTEKNLMIMLRKMAQGGQTIIMVTHTVQNIHLCDRVICMGSGGLLCYSGSPQGAREFFGKENITDIYDDLNDNSKVTARRFAQRSQFTGTAPAAPKVIMKKKYHFDLVARIKQFGVLTQRYSEIMLNDKKRLLMLLLMPVLLTGFVCIGFQADGNFYSKIGYIIDRVSYPFLTAEDTMKLMFTFACASFWIGIFNSVQEISKERVIYDREAFTGVKAVPYVMSKFVVITLLCLIQSVIMTFMIVKLTDITINEGTVTALNMSMNEGGVVFTNALWAEIYITTFLSMLSAMCLGLAISAAVSNELALVICPVCLLPQILFAGVAVDLSQMTEFISKVITCRWACIAYFTSTAINSMYEKCSYNVTWELTEFENGFGVDEAYSYYKTYIGSLNPVLSSWTALLIMSVVCVIFAVIVLMIRNATRKK